jgi:hypothetical protein
MATRRDRLGRLHRIHPGAHHRAHDPFALYRTGIGLGFIALALRVLAGRLREINAASAAIAGAFLLKLIFA